MEFRITEVRLVLQNITPFVFGSVEEDHENEIRISCRNKFEFYGKALDVKCT
jgi:hypothetical protein